MYLKSKAAGVQINKMYIPRHLTGFTARIINFVLETPFIETGKAEFVIEEGDRIMTDLLKEEQFNTFENTSNEDVQTENQQINEDEIFTKSVENSKFEEALKSLALLSTMMKMKELTDKLKDIDRRLCAIENSKCCCSQTNEAAA